MMMVQGEEVVGISVHDWHIRIKRTTIHGFKALLSSRLRAQVTTGRAASHCARGSRFARWHSASFGTSARLGLYPFA